MKNYNLEYSNYTVISISDTGVRSTKFPFIIAGGGEK